MVHPVSWFCAGTLGENRPSHWFHWNVVMNANETEALVSSVRAQWTRCNSNFPTEETRKQHSEGRAGGLTVSGFCSLCGGRTEWSHDPSVFPPLLGRNRLQSQYSMRSLLSRYLRVTHDGTLTSPPCAPQLGVPWPSVAPQLSAPPSTAVSVVETGIR